MTDVRRPGKLDGTGLIRCTFALAKIVCDPEVEAERGYLRRPSERPDVDEDLGVMRGERLDSNRTVIPLMSNCWNLFCAFIPLRQHSLRYFGATRGKVARLRNKCSRIAYVIDVAT